MAKGVLREANNTPLPFEPKDFKARPLNRAWHPDPLSVRSFLKTPSSTLLLAQRTDSFALLLLTDRKDPRIGG